VPSAAPRILFVDNQVRDFFQYRLSLASALRACGWEVHVALPREEELEEIVPNDVIGHSFYMKRMSVRPLDELRTLVELLGVYRRVRPTLVHHFCLKPSLYGGLAARLCQVPSVVSTFTGLGYLFTARSPTARALRRFTVAGLRFGFRHANHVAVVQSENDRNRLVRGGIVPADRAVVINGSGVDLSVFRFKPEPRGMPVVLMACRLLWDKGVAEFVAAASGLRRLGVRARFVLVGEPDFGHPSAIPMSTLITWRAAGDVEWLGWRDDMPALIAASHIVCLPSYYGEGIPRVLIEAAATGRPIIATESCGRELIRHGLNGLIVPARDSEALADALLQLLQDAPRRRMMGRRGQAIVASGFSLERVIHANFAVYRSILTTSEALPVTATK
jgi:glycosyltransferase involved in cell wall biosynthesis